MGERSLSHTTKEREKDDVHDMSQNNKQQGVEAPVSPPSEGKGNDQFQRNNAKLPVTLPRRKNSWEHRIKDGTKEREKDGSHYMSQNNEYQQGGEAPVSLPSEGKSYNRSQRSNSKLLVTLPRKKITAEPSLSHTTKEREKDDVHDMSQNNKQQGGKAPVSPQSEGKGN